MPIKLSIQNSKKSTSTKNYLQNELNTLIKENDLIFDFVQKAALDGLWFWDLEDPENEWMDDKFWTVLGYDPKVMPHKSSAWQDIINQEDLALAMENANRHLHDPSYSYDQVVRYTHKLGHTLWIQCRGLVIRNAEGKPVRMLGAHTDITKLKKVEFELQRQLQRYEHIIEGSNIGTWEWDLKTDEVIFNEGWARMIGYTLIELRPLSMDTWLNGMEPIDVKKFRSKLKTSLQSCEATFEFETRVRHKNGSYIWFLDRGKVMSWDKEGNPERMIGSRQEITESKKNIERYRAFIEQAPSALAMFDLDMCYLAASRQWFTDYDIHEEDIIGKSHYEVFSHISEEWKEQHRRCLEGEILKSKEDKFYKKDGSVQWLSWEMKPWFTDTMKIGGIIMHVSDITELKQIEHANQQKQTFLEAILDSIEVGIVSCDQSGTLTLFNKTTKNWHGLPPEVLPTSELSGYYGLFKPDGKTPLETEEIPLLRTLKNGSLEADEIIIKPNEGFKRYVSVNGSQLRSLDGEIFGAVVAMHDITERKNTEEKLRISEETFRANFENAAIGMAISNCQYQWIEVNEAFSEIVGYTISELQAMTFKDITHEDDLALDLQLLNELTEGIRTHYHMEKRYIHKEGYSVHVILAVSLVRDSEGSPLFFVSQIIDISPRIEAKNRMLSTLAELKILRDSNTQVGIIGLDKKGAITSFNKGAENLLGYSFEEIEGTSVVDFYRKEELKKRSNELYESHKEQYIDFDVLTALSTDEIGDTSEWEYVRKDRSTFSAQSTLTILKDEFNISGYLLVITDVSEIKKVEGRLKSLLEVAEDQNKRLKNFAYIVSHNLRSHSGNFSMLLNLFHKEFPEFSDNEILKLFKNASDSLAETIGHLSEVVVMSASVDQNLNKINLSKIVNSVLQGVLSSASENNVKIKVTVPKDMEVLALPAYLESIVLNLTTNAIKYRRPTCQSTVSISATKKDGFVVISFADNGLGIDLNRNRSKLFKMYKTFHKHEDARGIGLFITKNQIEALGGKITVESEVNKGSNFKVYLRYIA
ncbi:PAS domain S-box protein [Aquimarina intermedia]|uniref:histidine kinase n=1 Tax=Aquimarina intermedia TaxID=350814 RepID=A0A5S5C8Z6_9FLAO|nr:PAS domain S-box protein [Aquimarina intermedia]TYP75891.1 PAS domain S-box-containing protein [Aquimarina intermedia]